MITSLLTSLGALGGLEAIKWLATNRSSRRLAAAEASQSEFHTLKLTTEFLQEQLRSSEERLGDLSTRVAELDLRVIDLTRQLGHTELELEMKRCEVRQCPNRQPKNEF